MQGMVEVCRRTQVMSLWCWVQPVTEPSWAPPAAISFKRQSCKASALVSHALLRPGASPQEAVQR